jgi:ABC-type polar amino acid transport system ATPase subunit
LGPSAPEEKPGRGGKARPGAALAGGLAAKAEAFPDELSGGHSSGWPSPLPLHVSGVILFDEPTSALDPTMVSEVLGVIGAWRPADCPWPL